MFLANGAPRRRDMTENIVPFHVLYGFLRRVKREAVGCEAGGIGVHAVAKL